MSPGYTILLIVAIALIVSFGTLRLIDQKLSKITLNLPKIKVPPQEIILKVDNQDQCQIKINGKKANLKVKSINSSDDEEGTIETMKNTERLIKKNKNKSKKVKYNSKYHNKNPYQQLYEKFDVMPQLPPQAQNHNNYLN